MYLLMLSYIFYSSGSVKEEPYVLSVPLTPPFWYVFHSSSPPASIFRQPPKAKGLLKIVDASAGMQDPKYIFFCSFYSVFISYFALQTSSN